MRGEMSSKHQNQSIGLESIFNKQTNKRCAARVDTSADAGAYVWVTVSADANLWRSRRTIPQANGLNGTHTFRNPDSRTKCEPFHP